MSTLPRSTRLNSKYSVKCGAFTKLVKYTDPSGIGFSHVTNGFMETVSRCLLKKNAAGI